MMEERIIALETKMRDLIARLDKVAPPEKDEKDEPEHDEDDDAPPEKD